MINSNCDQCGSSKPSVLGLNENNLALRMFCSYKCLAMWVLTKLSDPSELPLETPQYEYGKPESSQYREEH